MAAGAAAVIRRATATSHSPSPAASVSLLIDTVARHGTIPPACEYIPPETPCVTEGMWRARCEQGCISEGSPEAARKAFYRAAKDLIKRGLIGKHDLWVWPVR